MFARRLLAAARPSAAWRTPSSSPSMTMMMAMAMSSTTTRTVSRTAVPVVEQSALFAVVHVSGHQYKVSVGDVITTQRIRDANVGDDFKCDKVLAIGGANFTTLGTPLVPDAHVTLSIEEQTKGDKIIVFKKKRRKRYERQYGHRQDVTIVRVTAIESPAASQTAPASLAVEQEHRSE